MLAARDMAEETARLVGCPVEQVLVASTGVIGVALPIEKIRSGLPIAVAALAVNQGAAAARAIMTTDPFPKEAAVQVTIGGRGAAIGGMAKGSGMIEPMMATMLGVRHHRCGGAEAAARPRAARSGQRHVQRHHRRRRVLDQRLRDAARQRRRRRHGRRLDLRGVRRRPADGLPRAGARHRARRRRSDQARHRHGDRRGVGGGRPARRQGDRQLAAGENRHPRRRPQLGPADCRRRPRQCRVRAVARRGRHRLDRPVPGWAALRRGGAARGGIPEAERRRGLGRPRRRAAPRRRSGRAT